MDNETNRILSIFAIAFIAIAMIAILIDYNVHKEEIDKNIEQRRVRQEISRIIEEANEDIQRIKKY